MQPSKPGRTRTAPPMRPAKFPTGGNYLRYTLFDATGIVYMLIGFVALAAVWALGSGEEAWKSHVAGYEHPLVVAFHLLCLASVVFVGVRFFRLFPKAQPARIGPVKSPPHSVILIGLYVAWIGVTLVFAAILAGGIF
jgi:fumarate reductase subunit C